MSIFPDMNLNHSQYFWIAARILQGTTFLIAPIYANKQSKDNLFLFLYLAAITWGTFAITNNLLPSLVSVESNYSKTRIILEIILATLFPLSLIHIHLKKEYFDKRIFFFITCAILASMASELIITFNTDVTHLVSIIGLDLKVISYFLIFQTTLVIGISQPQIIFYHGLQTDWEQLQKLINNLNEGICIIDLHDQFQFSNPAADYIFGLERGNLIEHHLSDFISSNQQLIYNKQKKILQKSQTNSYELEITQPNNKTRSLMVTASLQILDEKQIGTFVIFHDITESKEKVEKLKESEEKFRLLAENADVGIHYYGISGELIYLNDKAKEQSRNISHNDIGENIVELLGQKWGAIGKSRIDQTSKSPDTLTFEDEIIHDKVTKWYTVHYTRILDNQNKCIGVQIISQDITNQKIMENELQSLARFPQENPHPVLRLSREGQVVYSNQSGKKILDYWKNKEGSQFPEQIQKIVDSSIKNNLSKNFEVDTGKNITNLFLTPIPEMGYANIYGRDITELKKLENELQSLARFPQENPNPVLRLSKTGKVIYANQGGEILLEKWDCKDSQQVPENLMKIIKTSLLNNKPEIMEIQSGKNILSLYITPIPDLNYINIYGRDVTDLKNAEAKLFDYSKDLEKIVSEKTNELLQAQERLIRQERLATMGQLAGSVGHELRNPLAVINNAVFILNANTKSDDKAYKQYLDIINQEVASANKIITDLLTFARIKPASLNPTNPKTLIFDVLEKFVPPDIIKISNKMAGSLPSVYIDCQQIQQVIANLVINAYQAMPTGGKLTITGSEIKGKVRLDFIDTGVGIPQENLEKIFEPLFTTKLKGIGLGLTVSKILAEINDGKIEVKSDVENGSTFSLFLPILKDNQDIENL